MEDRRDFADFYPGVGVGVSASSASGYDAAARARLAGLKSAVEAVDDLPERHQDKDVVEKLHEFKSAIAGALVMVVCLVPACANAKLKEELWNDDDVALIEDVEEAVAEVTLASAAESGGFEGTETLDVKGVDADWFGFPNYNVTNTDPLFRNIGFGFSALANVEGYENMGYGASAINDHSGNENFGGGIYAIDGGSGDWKVGVGFRALSSVSGNYNYGFGYYAIDLAHAEYSFAFGRRAFRHAFPTNSLSIGINNGVGAIGSNRLYMDVYDKVNNYLNATNNAVFIDNGQLNLGRSGPFTNTAPNRLRGEWQRDDGALLSQLVTSNDLSEAIDAIPTFTTNYVNGILLPDHATNITYTLIITNGLLSTWEVLP